MSQLKNVLYDRDRPCVIDEYVVRSCSQTKSALSSTCLGQLFVQLWVQQRHVLVDISVKHERKHGQHRVCRRVPNHQPPLVDRDWRKVKHGRKDGLDDRDDQAAVDDKLRELGRPLVRVATVPHEQFGQVAELVD